MQSLESWPQDRMMRGAQQNDVEKRKVSRLMAPCIKSSAHQVADAAKKEMHAQEPGWKAK